MGVLEVGNEASRTPDCCLRSIVIRLSQIRYRFILPAATSSRDLATTEGPQVTEITLVQVVDSRRV